MKFNLIEIEEITDFEKKLGVELIITERPKRLGLPKYDVKFDDAEVMQSGFFIGVYGEGKTMDEALKDYCKIIETNRIAIHPYTDKRAELICPKLIHTKLLNK